MPFCPNCGHEVAEGVAFCPQCGAAQGTVAMAAAAAALASTPDSDPRRRPPDRHAHRRVRCCRARRDQSSLYGVPVFSNFIGIAYLWYFNAIGQTLGQRAMGIRIIDAEGNPPGAGRGLGRVLASILSGLVLGLGYIWAAFHPQKRTWHDSIAGTWVIRG
jgi:uncharacterized RDD family membrane protein YckC